ncbi:butyrophilin-like protein 1 [Chaetodon auriga]|uniref:butyrophilin-like protein 1 n=1 Tax=Chaetodon auriga TaxID=39042 RepID=UPI004032BCEE
MSRERNRVFDLLYLSHYFFLVVLSEIVAGLGHGPVVVKEGSDALLPCSLSTKENIEGKLFDWKKDGEKEVFMYEAGVHDNNGRPGQDEQFKGRVSHFEDELKLGNASIIIRNTKVDDSGSYTCDFPHLQPRQTFIIELVVGPVVVKEGSDALLPCSLSTKENIEGKLFDWKKDGQKEVFLYEAGVHSNNGRSGQDEQFKGRVSHFEDELKHGNASIIIRNTKVDDSGSYTCDFPRLQPRQTFHIELVVEPILKDRSHEITDAAPKPFITVADVTELSVQLRCDIRGGFPQPELIWMDGDQRVLPADEPQVSEREGRYDVTLQTTVTASTTNRFRCVATQLMIGHMTDAEIAVSEKLFGHRDTCSRQLVVGWICGVSIGVLMSLAALLLLRALKRARCLHYQTSVQREHCPFEKKRPHENMDLTEKWPRPETKNKAEVPTLLL